MIQTIWGSTTKPASSKKLSDALSRDPELVGTLYIGYPILGTPEGAFPFDAILLSEAQGIIIFDVVEGRDVGQHEERQDNAFSKLSAKLLQYRALVERRSLVPLISAITFAPLGAEDAASEYPILNESGLAQFVSQIAWNRPDKYPDLAAAVQSLSTIRKSRRRRDILTPDSRGAKIQRLNDSIANLDVDQGAAVVETVEGVQRIRGLAGSGKTIVLALKVAYLHAQNPDWRIAVTFNTRSLKGQFERLINTFVIEQTNEEPDWRKIEIVHSWGSSTFPGMYYRFASDHSLTYFDFGAAKKRFPSEKEFEYVCNEALSAASGRITPRYDVILIDEAQDLPPSFLRLCYQYLKPPKRLVYAYDELQTLTNNSVAAPEILFGEDERGRPLVKFEPDSAGRPRQDIILERCYRNSRPILATAHSLGFGIYREPGGLIQMFDRSELWLDVGYQVREGSLEDGQSVSLERTSDTSPRFLESHSTLDDIIQFKTFGTPEEQTEWLVSNIRTNLEHDELSADDIIVINPDPLTTREAVASARASLFETGINSSLAGVSSSPDVFFEEGVVTFTGIFRAKGNEAAMIYIINANDCYDSVVPAERTRRRNRLFTAITRSKAWVRVLGVGPRMDSLISEYQRVKDNNYTLSFIYPDEETRKELRIINREMTKDQQNTISRTSLSVDSIAKSLEAGDVRIEDLSKESRDRLIRALKG